MLMHALDLFFAVCWCLACCKAVLCKFVSYVSRGYVRKRILQIYFYILLGNGKGIPDEACKLSFKQGRHDEASQLLLRLQQPAALRTNYNLVDIPGLEYRNVSLLHLAALHGWMDIVASLVCEYNCSVQCCDTRGHTSLHYAAYGGSLPVVQYLITE